MAPRRHPRACWNLQSSSRIWVAWHAHPIFQWKSGPTSATERCCKRFLSGKLWTASFTGVVASPKKPKGSSRWRATSCRPRALGNLCRNSFSVELYNGALRIFADWECFCSNPKIASVRGLRVPKKTSKAGKAGSRKITKSFLRSGAHKPSTRFSGFNTPFCAGHSNIYLIEHDTVERTVGSVPSHVTQDHGLCFFLVSSHPISELRGGLFGQCSGLKMVMDFHFPPVFVGPYWSIWRPLTHILLGAESLWTAERTCTIWCSSVQRVLRSLLSRRSWLKQCQECRFRR